MVALSPSDGTAGNHLPRVLRHPFRLVHPRVRARLEANARFEGGTPSVFVRVVNPSKLLDRLTTLASRGVAASPRWPKSPERLAIELRRMAPQLRVHGIFVNLARCNKGRVVQLSLAKRLVHKNDSA